MQCPECSYNQHARQGLTCSNCGYVFTFNPKHPGKLTDGKFLAMIRVASQNDTRYYTQNQLYGVYCRRVPDPRWGCGIAAGLALLLGILLANFLWAAMFLLVGMALAMFLLLSFMRPDVKSPEDFDAWVRSWLQAGKPLTRMLREPGLHEPPPDWSEPDIYDYGAERILIVERDLLVDLFVRNEEHAEHRMLVMAESGYPQYLLPLAQRLLAQRSDLPVFLLHDATTWGREMPARVQREQRFPLRAHPLIDLGFTPEDFRRLKPVERYAPRRGARDLPVDALPGSRLRTGLTLALEQQVPLADLLYDDQRLQGADSGNFG